METCSVAKCFLLPLPLLFLSPPSPFPLPPPLPLSSAPLPLSSPFPLLSSPLCFLPSPLPLVCPPLPLSSPSLLSLPLLPAQSWSGKEHWLLCFVLCAGICFARFLSVFSFSSSPFLSQLCFEWGRDMYGAANATGWCSPTVECGCETCSFLCV